jgi:hypothetical protein
MVIVMLMAPLFPKHLQNPPRKYDFLRVEVYDIKSFFTNSAVCNAFIVWESNILYPTAHSFKMSSHSSLFSQKNDKQIDRWHSCVAIQNISGAPSAIPFVIF